MDERGCVGFLYPMSEDPDPSAGSGRATGTLSFVGELAGSWAWAAAGAWVASMHEA